MWAQKTVRISTRKKSWKKRQKTSSRKEPKRRQDSKRGEKSKKQEEEKPKKFQFIHPLNKYNIRYGVFMYIIHFQRNVQSAHGLWCEKNEKMRKAREKLMHWVYAEMDWVYAPGTERRIRRRKGKKTRNEKLIHRLYEFCKSCTYRHIDVFISLSLLELWTMLLQASEEWTPYLPLPHYPRGPGRRRNDDEKKRKTRVLIRSKNMCTVQCKRSFLYLILLRSTENENTAHSAAREMERRCCSGLSLSENDIRTRALCERLKKTEELSFFAAASLAKKVEF